jgi:hypothetical protein
MPAGLRVVGPLQPRQSLAGYVFGGNALSLVTAPLIYSLLLPLALIDAWATAFQWVCFPIYGIARVPREQYFVLDRHRLAYLNGIEKAHCVFCTYALGVVAYVREIGARTEQYWCPIKHSRAIPSPHERYRGFTAYGDAQGYRRDLPALRAALGERTASRHPPARPARIPAAASARRRNSVAAIVLAAGLLGSPVFAQDPDGRISGVVVDASGDPVGAQRLELRRPAGDGFGRLVGTSDGNGRFIFEHLGPGDYEIELYVAGRRVATSGTVVLMSGNTSVEGIVVVRPGPLTSPPPVRPRASAGDLLQGAPVTTSFDSLRTLLEPGDEIVVRDEEGGRTRGRVSSVSDEGLVIAVCRWWSPCRPSWLPWLHPHPYSGLRTYPPASIVRVDPVDSTSNGALIGFLAGFGVAAASIEARYSPSGQFGRPFLYLFVAPMLAGTGAGLGAAIDRAHTSPVYKRPLEARRVLVVPWVEGGRVGVAARLLF